MIKIQYISIIILNLVNSSATTNQCISNQNPTVNKLFLAMFSLDGQIHHELPFQNGSQLCSIFQDFSQEADRSSAFLYFKPKCQAQEDCTAFVNALSADLGYSTDNGNTMPTCPGSTGDWQTNFFVSLKLVSEIQSMSNANKAKFKEQYNATRNLSTTDAEGDHMNEDEAEGTFPELDQQSRVFAADSPEHKQLLDDPTLNQEEFTQPSQMPSIVMQQLHVRYARNLWIQEDVFGCLASDLTASTHSTPLQKIMNLVADQEQETTPANIEQLRPLIPDGTFVEATQDPQYITTLSVSNTRVIENATKEAEWIANNQNMDLSQRLSISKAYQDQIEAVEPNNVFRVVLNGVDPLQQKVSEKQYSCKVVDGSQTDLNFYKKYKISQRQDFNSEPVPEYKYINMTSLYLDYFNYKRRATVATPIDLGTDLPYLKMVVAHISFIEPTFTKQPDGSMTRLKVEQPSTSSGTYKIRPTICEFTLNTQSDQKQENYSIQAFASLIMFLLQF